MRFDEVWMGQWQLDDLANLADMTEGTPGEAVEVGTWQGLSAIPIANAIYPRLLHVVDHWQGSTDIPSRLSDRDNYSIFMANVAEAVPGNNVCVHKQGWREFIDQWDKAVSFLHLDAEHTADEVASQISSFLPFMPKGSILSGDDWNWPGVQAGVYQHFPRDIIRIRGWKLWWIQI
jgi:hypothetical protein